MKISSKNNNERKVAALILITVLILGASIFWYLQGKNRSDNAISDSPNEVIDLEPATEEDQQQADQKKQNAAKQEEDPPTNDSKKPVKPVITIAGQFNDAQYGNRVEIRAYVSGIYEDTGKCTAEFTRGSTSFTRQVEALEDATTTRCDTVIVAREDFPSAGNWSVIIKYNSPRAEGLSDVRMFNVE